MATDLGEDKSYRKIRTQVDQIRYEFTNQDTIALRKSGVYHKAVGNSAVVLKILGAKTKIRSHFDTSYKQEVLEMNLHSRTIGETKDYLKTLSSTILRDDELFFIVRLKEPISAKRIKRARLDPALTSEVTQDILMKRRQETPMARDVREIFKEVGILVRTAKNQDGLVFGIATLQEVIGLQRAVRVLIRQEEPSEDIKQAVDDAADNLQGMLLLTPNFVEQSPRLARIGRSAAEPRQLL